MRRLDPRREPGASRRAPETRRAPIGLRYTVAQQDERVTRLAWSPDGGQLAVPSRDGAVRLHDAATGALRATLEGHADAAMGVCWSPTGRTVASIGSDDRVMVWNAATGEERQRIEEPSSSLTGIAWSPCGRLVAASAESGSVLLWDASEAGRRSVLAARAPLASPGALHLAFAPEGGRIVVGSRDGRVRLWEPWSGVAGGTLLGHGDAAVICAWAPGGRIFATGSKDGTIRLWDAATAQPVETLYVHRDHVTAIAFRHDGALLASKSRDGSVLLWRPGPWRVVAAIPEQSARIGWSVGLAFHPGEPWLATLGERDRIVRVWELDVEGLPSAPLDPAVIDSVARPWPDRIPGVMPGGMERRGRLVFLR